MSREDNREPTCLVCELPGDECACEPGGTFELASVDCADDVVEDVRAQIEGLSTACVCGACAADHVFICARCRRRVPFCLGADDGKNAGVCDACAARPVRHDNIGTACAILHHHGASFAFTGGALRRLVYAAQGRESNGSDWCVGFRRMVDHGYMTTAGQPKVRGRPTYALTDKGREAVRKRFDALTLPTSTQTDPLALLVGWERYAR